MITTVRINKTTKKAINAGNKAVETFKLWFDCNFQKLVLASVPSYGYGMHLSTGDNSLWISVIKNSRGEGKSVDAYYEISNVNRIITIVLTVGSKETLVNISFDEINDVITTGELNKVISNYYKNI